jgi:hypothetical protein
MAVEKDFERLDDYLSNRLNGQEKVDFEKQLESDPGLKKELRFQQSLITGIQKARAAELKGFLNNIPVSNLPSGQSSLVKVGAWVVAAGVVVTSLYFYFAADDSAQQPVQITEEVTPPTAEQESNDTPAPEVEPKSESSHENTVAKTEKPADEVKKAPAKKPTLEVYDPTQSEEASDFDAQEQLAIISKAFVTSSIAVETEKNTTYKFHYVFRDKKLVLFGLFEKDLYEILEFIHDDKRTVFLYYKSTYYWLNLEQTSPAPLVPIRDQKLLQKLKDFRKN